MLTQSELILISLSESFLVVPLAATHLASVCSVVVAGPGDALVLMSHYSLRSLLVSLS